MRYSMLRCSCSLSRNDFTGIIRTRPPHLRCWRSHQTLGCFSWARGTRNRPYRNFPHFVFWAWPTGSFHFPHWPISSIPNHTSAQTPSPTTSSLFPTQTLVYTTTAESTQNYDNSGSQSKISYVATACTFISMWSHPLVDGFLLWGKTLVSTRVIRIGMLQCMEA